MGSCFSAFRRSYRKPTKHTGIYAGHRKDLSTMTPSERGCTNPHGVTACADCALSVMHRSILEREAELTPQARDEDFVLKAYKNLHNARIRKYNKAHNCSQFVLIDTVEELAHHVLNSTFPASNAMIEAASRLGVTRAS